MSSLTLANITSATSRDGGNTFVPVVVSDPVPVNDRQWNAAYGAETLYLSWRSLNTGNQLFCARSDNGGATFGAPVPVYDDIVGTTISTQLGNLCVDERPVPAGTLPLTAGPDGQGAVYHGYMLTTQDAPNGVGHRLYVAVSKDFGVNWTSHLVVGAPLGGTFDHNFSWVAVDRDGNVYTTFSDDKNVYYCFSTDQGDTWSRPIRVSNGGDTKTAIFPMVEAGSAGRIAFGWYGSTVNDSQDPTAQWHYFHARTTNALDALPTFEQVRVSRTVVHTGRVCQDGLSCADDGSSCGDCRQLLELAEIAVSPVDGSSFITFGGFGTTGVQVARQVGGTSSLASVSLTDPGTCPTLANNCLVPPPPPQSACVIPGVTATTDIAGDYNPTYGNPESDVLSVSIAEPWFGTGINNEKLVVTLQMSQLPATAAELPLNTLWTALFKVPGNDSTFFVQMNTCDPTAVPSFEVGYAAPATPNLQQGRFNADAGAFFADGRIQITVRKRLVGRPQTGQTLSNVTGETRFLIGALCSGSIQLVDVSPTGTYTLVGNAACIGPTVSCPADFTETAGQAVPLSFSVTNPSTLARTYDVSLSDDNGWLVGAAPTSLGPVGPGQTATFPITLELDDECAPAPRDTIRWSVAAVDAPSLAASCRTVATCDRAVSTLVSPLEAFASGSQVDLAWSSSAIEQIMGWNLYRGSSFEGAIERVNAEMLPMGEGGSFSYRDQPGVTGTVVYRLHGVGRDGTEQPLESISVLVDGSPIEFGFRLAGRNPFRNETSFRYSLPAKTPVRVSVYNVAGQLVRSLVNGELGPGSYDITFGLQSGGGARLAPGLYLVRIDAGAHQKVLRVIGLE